jgi:hypothetical protein
MSSNPKDMAGAVDLGALKQPPARQKEAALAEVLMGLGMVCRCGLTIGDENGVQLVVVREQVRPGAQGIQRGLGVEQTCFCSQRCSTFQEAGQRAMADDSTQVVAVRMMVPTQFLKLPEDEVADGEVV